MSPRCPPPQVLFGITPPLPTPAASLLAGLAALSALALLQGPANPSPLTWELRDTSDLAVPSCPLAVRLLPGVPLSAEAAALAHATTTELEPVAAIATAAMAPLDGAAVAIFAVSTAIPSPQFAVSPQHRRYPPPLPPLSQAPVPILTFARVPSVATVLRALARRRAPPRGVWRLATLQVRKAPTLRGLAGPGRWVTILAACADGDADGDGWEELSPGNSNSSGDDAYSADRGPAVTVGHIGKDSSRPSPRVAVVATPKSTTDPTAPSGVGAFSLLALLLRAGVELVPETEAVLLRARFAAPHAAAPTLVGGDLQPNKGGTATTDCWLVFAVRILPLLGSSSSDYDVTPRMGENGIRADGMNLRELTPPMSRSARLFVGRIR